MKHNKWLVAKILLALSAVLFIAAIEIGLLQGSHVTLGGALAVNGIVALFLGIIAAAIADCA